MKSLLLSLVLIPCLAWGQKKDSLVIKGDVTPTNLIGGGGSTEVFPKSQAELFYESKSKQDTIKVLMLVCDTSIFSGNLNYKVDKETGVITTFRSDNLWWQFGYEVRRIEKRNNWEGEIDPMFTHGFKPQEWNVYFHVAYLDENKKPLSKNIVVWQTKEIK